MNLQATFVCYFMKTRLIFSWSMLSSGLSTIHRNIRFFFDFTLGDTQVETAGSLLLIPKSLH
jgi:hypothetical protein